MKKPGSVEALTGLFCSVLSEREKGFEPSTSTLAIAADTVTAEFRTLRG